MTKKVKDFLVSIGYLKSDFFFIDRDSKFMSFSLGKGDNFKTISRATARKKLSFEDFWSGIARATFHHSACRSIANGGEYILIENSFLE